MVDWQKFGVTLCSMVIAVALIIAIVVLIIFDHKQDIPSNFEFLLTACVVTGILGAALQPGKPT